MNTRASVIVAYGVKTVLKKAIKEDRPDYWLIWSWVLL